ncbi:MAG TPA: ATP-binding cassette domain-containing protein [Anaerolineaceae bacterium]|nr:ATP-binding cassette domain-containing protein [Anaerolineaceae bacterium]
MPEPVVIQCREVNFLYPNGVQAIHNISLSIYRGDYIAFVGQNGSGKTTLVKHFNGLLKPSSGSVTVFGEETRDKKVSYLSRKVGYVFQNPDDMLFSSSVADEIAYGPRMLKVDPEQVSAKVESILQELDLKNLRDTHPFALSLGDRQRLAVACALSLDPEVFVFDEPTTGQDFFGSQSIMGLIDELHQKGKTVVIITHDMPIVAEHAQRVIVMNKGEIALEGTPQEVFSQVEKLQSLSLKAPQVTLLARALGESSRTILHIPEMVDWLQTRLPVTIKSGEELPHV